MSNNAVTNSFDSGLGSLSNAWNVGAPVNGAVTLANSASMMEWATGPNAGHGYGTYEVTAKVDGSQPGAAIVLWPGDNKWPGQEIDMMEVTPDGSGRQYATVHWNDNGHDSFKTVMLDGVSGGQFHDYKMVWEPGKITFSVDGDVKGAITSHVPTDFDHGGMNNTIGVMNNNSHTAITVSDVAFTPLGSTTAVHATPVAAAAPATSTGHADAGHIDWNALAAQVTANYEATGHWFL